MDREGIPMFLIFVETATFHQITNNLLIGKGHSVDIGSGDCTGTGQVNLHETPDKMEKI